MQQLLGARDDVPVFQCEVTAVIHQIGRGRGFHFRALDHDVIDDLLQILQQVAAGGGDYPVLLHQLIDHRLQLRVALRQTRKCHVLARMVIAIGKIAQVAHQVEHQFEVRLVVGMERRHLPLQQIEQPREVPVFGVPQVDRISHAASRARVQFA